MIIHQQSSSLAFMPIRKSGKNRYKHLFVVSSKELTTDVGRDSWPLPKSAI